MSLAIPPIRSIVFDLDGTLYSAQPIADQIQRAAETLIAATRGLSLVDGRALLRRARRALTDSGDEEPTLTRTCQELGIEIAALHRAFQEQVRPEDCLVPDPVLRALLESLSAHCRLYIYTNNSYPLAQRILALLDVSEYFERLYTIEYCGQPKPDLDAFRKVVEDIGGLPESFLFVGDREPVDLRPAADAGMATLLVRETADLLQIHRLLGIIP
ncbi:HAD family hydrolase [Desulfuromonas carbonis]|uniref:HAD family hydrolase n=1 Tax=Desulfuromonas sp. DDH964 TaxID=1823759 RepID=UPI00078C1E24|nr:HAD family hydrolase [Desulfuromonas sp. DDH964]AMV72984.1 HAD superfamily hydrolase [Desulfuromonas sp. DDH964]